MDFLSSLVQQVVTIMYNLTAQIGVPNYGLAIIIMTIIVKLALYPLTAKQIASTAKRDFESKIKRAWDTPTGSTGKSATARITLTESGAVRSIIVNSSDPDMKASIEAAVRAAAPYPMPSDPDARREAQNLTSTFKSSN